MLIGLALLLAAACAPPPADSSLTPTPGRLPTLDGPPVLRTLPPTWTPTFTPSPQPPPTDTPTPSPTATPALDALCEQFVASISVRPRQLIDWEGGFQMAFVNPWLATPIQFLAVHRRSGENLGVQFPPGGQYVIWFRADSLPLPGVYDWTMSLLSPDYGPSCTQEGSFTVRPPRRADSESATPTPAPAE